jgi:hypothetical protein
MIRRTILDIMAPLLPPNYCPFSIPLILEFTFPAWNGALKEWHSRLGICASSHLRLRIGLGRGSGWAEDRAGPRIRLGRGSGWAEDQAGPRIGLGRGSGWAEDRAGPRIRLGRGSGWADDNVNFIDLKLRENIFLKRNNNIVTAITLTQ